jgi:hypothetical protein
MVYGVEQGTFTAIDMVAEGGDVHAAAKALWEAATRYVDPDDSAIEIRLTTAADGAPRLLVRADGDNGEVTYEALKLLADDSATRVLAVIDGDEIGTQHSVVAARPDGPVCVHALQLVDPEYPQSGPWKNNPSYLETSYGLYDPGHPLWTMPKTVVADRSGAEARRLAAELYGVPRAAVDRAFIEIVERPHRLTIRWDTYGPWWTALGVPLPPWPGEILYRSTVD